MDGSLNYGENSHKRVTAKMIREDNSQFNTYKFKGLPPSPICAVSKEAINAAIKPAKTDYLYFVKTSDNGHSFTNSYNQHIKNIK
jgi:UPF0755 protein